MRAAILLVLAACSVPDKFLVDANGTGDGTGDGAAVASGDYVWIRSMSSVPMYGIADGAAGLVVVGGLTVPADLGGAQLTPVGMYDIAIAGFNEADASHIYSVRHGDVGSEFGFMDVTDANGAPMVYGLTSGTPYDLGLGPVTASGLADGFIGHYGPAAPVWVNRLYGPGDDKVLSTARGAGSTIYAGGYFEQTTNWNGGTLTSAGGRDIFLARMNTFTGAVELTKQYGGTTRDEIAGLATAANGVYLAGMFDDTITFGGTAPAVTATGGGLDLYVGQVDANGNGVWASHFGGTGDDRDPRLAVDAAGDIYMAGTFQNTLVFGTIPLVAVGGADVFVVKLSGVDHSVVWAKQFGGTGDDGLRAIAVDTKGNVVTTGWAVGAIDGGTTLGGADAVITSYSAADGSIKWRKVISTAGDDRAWALTFGTSGDLFVSIHLGGPFDFGHPVIGPASPACVIARIAP